MAEKPVPPRYLAVEEYSVEQHLRRLQARRDGHPEPRFENPAYVEARRALLRAHGFEEGE